MSDLFHQDVPAAFIARVFITMTLAEQHTFQVLTKRPQRMAQLFRAEKWDCPPNVWLGVSVENQRYADLRVPHLLATPASVRFLSVEPLLGPVDLHAPGVLGWRGARGVLHDEYASRIKHENLREAIDWVIVGGESGPGARPMHPQWVRDLRDQCVAAGVPFFFKQWGAWAPTDGAGFSSARHGYAFGNPIGYVHRIGKKAAGRELDGRTWEQMPA